MDRYSRLFSRNSWSGFLVCENGQHKGKTYCSDREKYG